MRVALAFLAIAGLAAQAASVQAPPPAGELAQRIQAHYATVKGFTATFTQTTRNNVFGKTSVERGSVMVKKPSRMRWTYSAPQKNELVADGTQIYFYVPSDRRVELWPMPKGDELSGPLLFLAGRGDLLRDFQPSLPANQPARGWRLDLTPKTSQADFTSLALIVDPQSLALIGFVQNTDQETLTFEFANLRENVPLADSAFDFKMPANVEVIKHDKR